MDSDIPPIGELESAAKQLVWTAQKQGNLRDFTPRLIRQTIEKQFKLEEGTLDASEFKSALKAATKYAIDNEPPADKDEDMKPKPSPQRKNKRKLDGKIKAEAKEEPLPKPKSTPTGKGKAKAKAVASEDEGSDAPTPTKKRKIMPKAKKIVSDKEDDYKEESVSPEKKPKTIKSKTKKIFSEDEDEEQEKAPRSTSSKPRTKQGRDSKVYKSAEHVPTSDMEQDEPDTIEVRKPIEIKNQPAPSTLSKRENVQPESSKSVEIEMEDAAQKSESELSVLIDEPPKPKRKKSKTGEKPSMKASEKSKSKKTAKSSAALSKDEETIKRLKSLVVACGMRKVWSKVFEGLDTPQQQIKKLREILTDLGMTGRMSMEQAKAIKEKRELEKELADVKEFAEKMTGRASRSQDKSSEDEEVEAPKRRPMNARKSIMAFLGDQSDEE
ncbi:hypothetical protein BJ912DRAFT_1053607 [Pholiota molesta]|nr:hypothetical protein BJ912DRAFT_1053607 [Pholiota molesta]